ncbi:MAG: FAD-dependent oxidoreductase [Flavobacteriales bacterium]|nr:FAD-dependent oxidoreductase [Flavobacteriales bacterium]
MNHPAHYVAVFGGAVAGSEAAHQLASRGIHTVVFDQATLPYGKIEDGLPKWHAKLRDKEEAAINEKLAHPLIRFVPNTKLGKDIEFSSLTEKWGFSAVLLATGAWKDRPLDIPGASDQTDRGLYYQNPLSYWFNHYHEPGYKGKTYEIRDNAVVIGGGLASIDMAKMIMMELVKDKLAEKGIETNILELDKGIDRVLDKHKISFEELGLKGCTLFYRRRNLDMPLSPAPTDTPEQLEKAQKVRVKVLENAQAKFFFQFEECCMPVALEEENGHLTGITLRKTIIEDNRVVAVENSDFTFPTSLVISSIGSIPEPIPGLPMDGQTFRISPNGNCQIDGYHNVFALGNAVTGRGNIKESLQHGREVSLQVMDDFLAWSADDYEKVFRIKSAKAGQGTTELLSFLENTNVLESKQIEDIDARVKARQKEVGYHSTFADWVKQHLPKRLEDIVESH